MLAHDIYAEMAARDRDQRAREIRERQSAALDANAHPHTDIGRNHVELTAAARAFKTSGVLDRVAFADRIQLHAADRDQRFASMQAAGAPLSDVDVARKQTEFLRRTPFRGALSTSMPYMPDARTRQGREMSNYMNEGKQFNKDLERAEAERAMQQPRQPQQGERQAMRDLQLTNDTATHRDLTNDARQIKAGVIRLDDPEFKQKMLDFAAARAVRAEGLAAKGAPADVVAADRRNVEQIRQVASLLGQDVALQATIKDPAAARLDQANAQARQARAAGFNQPAIDRAETERIDALFDFAKVRAGAHTEVATKASAYADRMSARGLEPDAKQYAAHAVKHQQSADQVLASATKALASLAAKAQQDSSPDRALHATNREGELKAFAESLAQGRKQSQSQSVEQRSSSLGLRRA